MQGPSFSFHADDDEVLDLQKPMSFNVPSGSYTGPPSGFAGPSLGVDPLINRKKVSMDVMSLSSSGSGSKEPSEYSETESERGGPPPPPGIRMRAPYQGGSDTSSVDDGTEGSEYDNRGSAQDTMASRFQAERSRLEKDMNEKKEILYQMDRLEAKGYRLPRKFSMQSDIEEMRAEYHRVLREKDVDSSIRFQRKMMMAMVTGMEFLNGRFDPFSVKLDGWSEMVHENINDYDDIFEELHDKYKNTGKKMAPELRLLMTLSGSAFMFHLTHGMFKQGTLPGVEQVLRSNPNLMKEFQRAAAQQMNDLNSMNMNLQGGAPSQAPSFLPQQAARGPGGGLFSMVGNLFGGGLSQPMSPPPMASRGSSEPSIESIIQDVRNDIASDPMNRMETMSVSDEEITSIIEDTADLNGILMNSGERKAGRKAGRKPAPSARTLNL